MRDFLTQTVLTFPVRATAFPYGMAELVGEPGPMTTEPAARKARNPGLTAAFVRSTKPGPKTRRCGDGGGLYPSAKPTGAKSWVLRVVVKGRRVEIGLGSAALMTLARARDKAIEARRAIIEGGDPLADRRRASVPTFEAAARKVIEFNKPTW